MKLADLDYDLPPERIAQQPVDPRDHARLLVVDRKTARLSDHHFYDLGHYLKPRDVLVLNDTKVIPARLTVVRNGRTRRDALFVREVAPDQWELMIPRVSRLKSGDSLTIAGTDVTMHVVERMTTKTCLVTFDQSVSTIELLERVGRMPLPPYIHRTSSDSELAELDRWRYQTVFSKSPGAIAAPTAGLHFTEAMLSDLRCAGIDIVTVTLHVGRGTFEPIGSDDLHNHRMHSEWFSLSDQTAERINAARHAGGRIVAVGTTAVRVLESTRQRQHAVATRGWSNLFIYPPYEFKAVDVLITNFHLPRTTLLALVYAFAGIDLARCAYRHAIEREYRFYSYGDAMLII